MGANVSICPRHYIHVDSALGGKKISIGRDRLRNDDKYIEYERLDNSRQCKEAIRSFEHKPYTVMDYCRKIGIIAKEGDEGGQENIETVQSPEARDSGTG